MADSVGEAGLGADFCAAARAAIADGRLEDVTDDTLRRVLSAAVKLYVAKVENDREFPPFEVNTVTATETVVAVCAMIRASDLNLVDLAMWFGRGAG